LSEDKEMLTVLDFVGNARAEYDFSSKFRGMLGKSHTSIVDEIENDFPHLPLGCSIVLQKQAKEVILNNIRRAVVNQRRLLSWLKGYSQHTTAPLTLASFINQYPSVKLEDLYKIKINGGGGWSRLCIKAGRITSNIDETIEKALFRSLSNRLLQCSSYSYLQFLKKLFELNGKWNSLDEIENQWALMAHYDFWQEPGAKYGFSKIEESLEALTRDSILKEEFISVVSFALERIEIEELPMKIPFSTALRLHARYTRAEILSAFGENRFDKKSSSREGVVDLKSINTELLFVTLQKTDKRFSPTTLYQDYAISENLFHWQSQNSARSDRGKGLSYVKQKETGKTIILFVREQSYDEFGRAMGFVNLGSVNIYSYHGSQPMNITWKLRTSLPSFLWKEAAKLALG